MKIRVIASEFDPWQALADYEKTGLSDARGKMGAASVFVGTMRDVNEGQKISAMTLEHYPGMTEQHLEKICRQATEKWPILNCLLLHRVGRIQPEQPIVLVAVWSEHRDDAFKACRYIIDELKNKAPFWKQEQTSDGLRWVEKNN